MGDYRAEARIFGLLIFALLATVVFYYGLAAGLSAAEVEGEVKGFTIKVAGSAACFIALILIFYLTGLFKLGLEDVQLSNRPADSLSKKNLQRQLDLLELTSKRISRRGDELKRTLTELESGKPLKEALEAGGMREVRRRSAK